MDYVVNYNENEYGNIRVNISISKPFLRSRKHALEFIDKIKRFFEEL